MRWGWSHTYRRVRTVLARHEQLDASGQSGLGQLLLLGQGDDGNHTDNGILAAQGTLERLRAEVGLDDLDVVGEGGR
jgi:hypothetical protein